MLKKLSSAFLVILLLTGSLAFARGLKITEMAFSEKVENHNPVNPDTSFSYTVGKVCCFTRVEGAQDTTQISHIWYHNDKEMAKVDLSVRSSYWRTWSSKQILKSWIGNWRVDVVNADGDVIKSKSFVIKK